MLPSECSPSPFFPPSGDARLINTISLAQTAVAVGTGRATPGRSTSIRTEPVRSTTKVATLDRSDGREARAVVPAGPDRRAFKHFFDGHHIFWIAPALVSTMDGGDHANQRSPIDRRNAGCRPSGPPTPRTRQDFDLD